MNLSQRGRKVKKNRGMSDTDSGRTREMIVTPRENLIEMEEKFKTLSESKQTPLQSVLSLVG